MQQTKKYYGFYRGKVVKQLNNGFCLIQIPGIIDYMDKEGVDYTTFPPAEQAQSLFGGGNTANGEYSYPDLNSIVWCFFENGELTKPVYFATSNAASDKWDSTVLPLKNDDMPGNDGIGVLPTARKVVFNGTSIEQSSLLNPDDNSIVSDTLKLTVDSRTTPEDDAIPHDKKLGLENPDAASITLDNSTNTLTMTAKDEIVLKAPSITLDTMFQGMPGHVTINSNNVLINTSQGVIRILNSHMTILSPRENILIYTRDSAEIK